LGSAFIQCHEKIVNGTAHTDRRQLPMSIRHSFYTTKLNKELEVKYGQ